jgi:hypothetical protein
MLRCDATRDERLVLHFDRLRGLLRQGRYAKVVINDDCSSLPYAEVSCNSTNSSGIAFVVLSLQRITDRGQSSPPSRMKTDPANAATSHAAPLAFK